MELTDCSRCKKKFAAKSAVCPFCGQKRDAAELPPESAAIAHLAAAGKEIPLAVVAAAAKLRAWTCPNCGTDKGLVPMPIEGWKDAGTTWRGARRFQVRSGTVPGYCGDCSAGLTRARLLAGALVMAPLVLSGLLGKAGLLVALLYTGYLIKKGYTWADGMLWGDRLEESLLGKLPAEWIGSDIRFPIGIVNVLARFGFFFVALLLSLGLGVAIWR